MPPPMSPTHSLSWQYPEPTPVFYQTTWRQLTLSLIQPEFKEVWLIKLQAGGQLAIRESSREYIVSVRDKVAESLRQIELGIGIRNLQFEMGFTFSS